MGLDLQVKINYLRTQNAMIQRKIKNLPASTLGEQTELINEWWSQLVNSYAKEIGQKDIKKIVHIPLTKVYDYLMKRRLVDDQQQGISLIQQQIGMHNLQNAGMLSGPEFEKIFCKSMFKFTLIAIL